MRDTTILSPRPLAIDLYCGVGGWTTGLLAEGYDVVGFDIERHQYGVHRYPAQLVIQDVRTLHGSQFRDAALIVASPPCQAYSWMAMPWKLAKAKAESIRADTSGRMLAELNLLFHECFRIQKEASVAAGRHIPMVVENVRGAQRWVGRARWNFGSYYLWGDVPALMPQTMRAVKAPGMNWSDPAKRGQDFTRVAGNYAKLPGFRFDGSGRSFQTASVEGTKVASDHQRRTDLGNGARFTSRDCGVEGTKNGNDWFGSGADYSEQRRHGSKTTARKAASAMIAKIPLELSRHIGRTFRPERAAA